MSQSSGLGSGLGAGIWGMRLWEVPRSCSDSCPEIAHIQQISYAPTSQELAFVGHFVLSVLNALFRIVYLIVTSILGHQYYSNEETEFWGNKAAFFKSTSYGHWLNLRFWYKCVVMVFLWLISPSQMYTKPRCGLWTCESVLVACLMTISPCSETNAVLCETVLLGDCLLHLQWIFLTI